MIGARLLHAMSLVVVGCTSVAEPAPILPHKAGVKTVWDRILSQRNAIHNHVVSVKESSDRSVELIFSASLRGFTTGKLLKFEAKVRCSANFLLR